MEKFDFGKWIGKIRPSIAISFDEDQVAEALMTVAVDSLPLEE
jgi:hypothetical protein